MVVQSEFRQEKLQGQDANDKRQRLRQRFEVIKKLGQGTYGKVQLAINKETNGEVAIKTIKKAKIENEQDLVRIRREIQIMASIQHPHIIHIYEVFENSEKIVLVMQYASGGELYDYLGCHRKLPEKEARRIFRQIAAAIYYCHKNKICHRDLKLENILLDDKGNAKIADFGLSNLFDERKKLQTFCGSPLYASPEIVKGTSYCGPEVDCWSLGVLLYTLVYGAMPFDGRNFKRLVKQISEGDYYEPSMKSKASGIIRRLLTVDVNFRATIKDICLDDWVNEGYNHSLFKLANDMADLTPAAISSSYAFPPVTPNAKDEKIQAIGIPTKNHHQNELLAYASLKRNDDLQAKRVTLLDSSPTIVSKIKDSAKEITATENAVPCEVRFVMGNILTSVEKMVRRSMLISSSKDTKHVNKVGSQIMANTESIIEKKAKGTDQNIIINLLQKSSLDTSMKNEDGGKGIDLLNKEESKHYRKNEINNSSNSSEVVLRKEISQNTNRETRRECIKTWNVSIDQAQHTQKEADSILPIFDVTSVIPKRPNRKSSAGLQEHLIQNGDGINQTVEKAISADPSNSENPRGYSKNNDEKIPPKFAQYTGTSDETEKSESLFSSLSKHRNDVIDYINNIFSRHKLSTQIVRHTELSTKENNNEAKVKQAEDTLSSNNNAQTINETAQQQLNTDISKQKVETNHTSTGNTTLTRQNIVASELSTTDESLSPEKADNCKPIENMSNQVRVCQRSDITEKSKTAENDCNDDFPHTDELKMPETIAIEPEQCTETVNLEITHTSKSLDDDKSLCNQTDHFLTKNPSQHSSSNSAEKKAESISDNRRISIRDTVKIDANEISTSKQDNYKKRLKNRSYSVGNNEKVSDLEKILRRRRKYSLCALLAASFELEQMATRQTRKDSDTLKKIPGKVEIPKSFDPSSESEPQTPIDKREFILIPSISVAENKQKMESEIEKVKMSALSMMRRKSETCSRRKMKQCTTRSCTDILQRMGDMNEDAFNLLQKYNEYELAQLNGSVDYLVDEHFKFGRELNFPMDQWAAEKFDCSQPLLIQGNESYVPISRCCKKINFPPKPQQNKEKTVETGEINNTVFTSDQYSGFTGEMNGIDGNAEHADHSNSQSKKLIKKKNTSQHSINDRNKKDSKLKQYDDGNTEEDDDNKSTAHSESIYSSSLDKDSSDNDDDLDEIFGTKIGAQGSEDLWQFLKSVNSDISNHLKRIKHNKSLCSRSKSQECKASVDYKTYEKLLTRSRSKEEKQNCPSTRPGPPESLKDSCYCSLASDFNQAHNSCTHIDKEQSDFSISMKNSQSLDEEFGSTERDIHFDTHPHLSGYLKEKYYSLSNLEDPRSFLYPQNFPENFERKKCKSWATVPDLDEGIEFLQKDGNISLSTARRRALYNTMRPRQLHTNKRSQSQSVIKPDNNDQETENETTSKSNRKVFYIDKEHSNSLRNKALSDFDISSKELPCEVGSLDNLINYDINSRNSQRFCKSLGSKLNVESLDFSSDLLSKISHKTKESCHKKRERKVSFLDVSKSKNSNFGLESVAKAQKVLNSIDREVDTSLPEETGTLLEALKTQGYKSLISQRLQESECSESSINRRYSWACMGNIANMFPESFPTLSSGKGNANVEDYARFLLWNRKTFGTAVDDINYGSEMLDDDIDIYDDTSTLNTIYGNNNYQKMDINWRTPPSTWLYQNLNNFRSSHASDEFIPQDWNNSIAYPTYNEVHDYDIPEFSNERHLNFHEGKISKNKHKSTLEHDQHVPTFNEAGLQTKSPNTIEKLSMKIKALKSRCNQKSFDDLSSSKDQLSESILGREAEQKRFSSPPDLTDNQDEGDSRESVSDRIWRKSFYSRFNDIPTLRRRRSTLMESDFSVDSFATKLPKHHVNEERLTDGLNIRRKEPTSSPLNERIDRKVVDDGFKKVDIKNLVVKENDQHIPHRATSEEQIDQMEDR